MIATASRRICIGLLWFCLLICIHNTAHSKLPNIVNECSFSGEFIQNKSIEGLPEVLSSSGTFYYHCEHGVIWKTNEPILESLIFKKDKSAYSVQDNRATKLNSKFSKFFGSLLFNLMNGKNNLLTQNFEILQVGDEYILLMPANNRIKKAIQKIEIRYFNTDDTPIKLLSPVPIEPHSIKTLIIDRNNEKTELKSIKNKTYTSSKPALQQCISDVSRTPLECETLIKSLPLTKE